MKTTTLDRTVDAWITALQHPHNRDLVRGLLQARAAADRPFVEEVRARGLERHIGAPFYAIAERLARIGAALEGCE